MAGVIPVDADNCLALQRWVKAEKAMHIFTGDVTGSVLSHPAMSYTARLELLYPLFKGDPFLESSYWEKQAQCAFFEKRYGDMVEPLEKAIHLGVPEAHLYNRLGVVFLVLGDFDQARWALNHALKYADNKTTAAFLYTHYLELRRPLRFP
jgi:hypothetical protein